MFGIGLAELIILACVGLMLVVGFVYLFMRREAQDSQGPE